MDEKARKREIELSTVIAGPEDGKRVVHVGISLNENFVTTASFFPAVKASPPRKNELVVLCQDRMLEVLELLITVEIFPVGATITKIPSFVPFRVCLAIVSELLPKRSKEPSLLLATAFNSVSDFPITIGLLNAPLKLDWTNTPAWPDGVEIIPTTLIALFAKTALLIRNGALISLA